MMTLSELKNHERELYFFHLRIGFAGVAVLVAFALLLARFVHLQVFQHDTYASKAEDNRISIVPIAPNRGLILDRNGVVLARNYSAYTLEIFPAKVRDLERTIQELGSVIEVNARDRSRFRKLLSELRNADSLPIRTRLSDEEVARFAANRYRFPGVDIKARLFRQYPHGETASHVVGYIGRISTKDQEKLAEAGETDRLKDAHLVYFLDFAETADPKLDGAEQAEWLQWLHRDHDNLRAALGWTLQQGKAQEARRLCGALGRFWATHGHLTEGRGWLTQALQERDAVSKEVQAKALRWAGILTWQQGDYEGTRGLYEESLAINRELGDKRGIANALISLGLVARDLGDYEGARGLYEESLAIFRELGNKRGIAYAFDNLGLVALEQHNTELARLHLEQSLRLREEIGYKIGIAYGLSSMAQVLHKEGRVVAAAQLQGACMALFEEMGAPMEPYEQQRFDKTSAILKQTLGEDAYQRAFDAGKRLTLEEAIALALAKPAC